MFMSVETRESNRTRTVFFQIAKSEPELNRIMCVLANLTEPEPIEKAARSVKSLASLPSWFEFKIIVTYQGRAQKFEKGELQFPTSN